MDEKLKFNIESHEFLLEKNDIYFIPPFTQHKISSVNGGKYEYMVICLHNKFAAAYENSILQNYIYTDKETSMYLLSICREFYDAGDYKKFEDKIIDFINRYIKVHEISIDKGNKEMLVHVSEYIKMHLEESFSLQDISYIFHISKYHLVRIFKKRYGITPYQFYLQEKVKKIEQGLTLKKIPVSLSYDYNFSDQSHLCNTFKKYVGITPLQFRKSYKKD